MIIWTIIFVAFMYIAFFTGIYATYRTGAKANGNMLLGVTLPHDALNDSAVNSIVEKYRKAYSFYALAFLMLVIPAMFFTDYISVSFLYFFVWVVTFIYVNHKIAVKYFDELYSLKREKEWWVGTQNIINIDTEVSRLKNTFVISKKWFIVPLIISAIPIITALVNNQDIHSILTTLIGILTLAVFYSVYHFYGKSRTKAYSENTEVNIALNHVYKREWSKCFFIIATLSSVFFTALTYLMNIENIQGIIAIVSCLYSLFIMVPIFSAYNKVRDKRNKMLRIINETMYTDDDLFWRGGIYDNPNDKNSVVEKRIGYGATINAASKGGKVVYASILLAAAIFVGVSIYIMPLDFGSVSLSVSEQVVTIKVPLKEFAFAIDDIKSVTMIDEFPHATRAGGANFPKLYTGRFIVTGYGSSDLFIYTNNPPYIAIELESGWLFINCRTSEQTEDYFNKLKLLIDEEAVRLGGS